MTARCAAGGRQNLLFPGDNGRLYDNSGGALLRSLPAMERPGGVVEVELRDGALCCREWRNHKMSMSPHNLQQI